MIKRIIKYIFIILVTIFIIGIIGLSITVYQVNKEYPNELLEKYEPITPSVIYDINGNQIDVLSIENRDLISIKDIPNYVQNAFIAVEDKRFRNHHGLDFIRLVKVVFLNVTGLGRQGGSTLTQQYIKTAFLTSERTIKRKIIEAILAVKLERIYTKDEILERYLNTINFGKGVYGIKNASLRYFGVLPDKLTIAQAAILASIPKSPSRYSQLKYAIPRHNIVLLSMYKAGFITEKQYEKAKNEKISFVLTKNLEDINEAQKLSKYDVAPEITTIVLNEMKKILKIQDDDIKALFNGYKIYSTIDLDMQKAAYKAFQNDKKMKKLNNLEGALISIDNSNGFVKAIVGGKNYKKGEFNRALYAKRQPGSSFKPVVYLAALQKNYPMNLIIENSPIKFGNWSPRNYAGDFTGNMTMIKALEDSNNISAVKLLNLVGINAAKKVWLDSGVATKNFSNDLTTALGSITTTPIDMATFYTALANGGYKIKPQFIYKIEDKYGNIVYEAIPTKEKIYESDDVSLMTFMLEQVVNSGTGKSAKLYKDGFAIPVAGKTGTTSDYISAWFTGYTPNITTVVYAGYDNNKSMGRGMTGSSVAIPIWKAYMQSVVNLPNYKVSNFNFLVDDLINQKLISRTIDNVNGFLDVDGINSQEALFKIGTEPVEKEKNFNSIFSY